MEIPFWGVMIYDQLARAFQIPLGSKLLALLILKLHSPHKMYLVPEYNRCYFPLPTCWGVGVHCAVTLSGCEILSPCGHLATMDILIIRTAAKSLAKLDYRLH